MSQAVDQIMQALEKRAGLDQTPEGRLAFWLPFSHLRYEERVKAGAEALRRLAQTREAEQAEREAARRKQESRWW